MPYSKIVWSTGDVVTATLANKTQTQYDAAKADIDVHVADAAMHVDATEKANWDSAYNATKEGNTQPAFIQRGLQKIYSDQSTPAHLKKLLGRTLINHMGRQGDFVSQFNRWDANLTIDTAVYKFGTSSGKIDNSAGTAAKVSTDSQKSYLAGRRVLLGVWAKAVSGTPKIRAELTGKDSAGSVLTQSIHDVNIDSTMKFYWKKFDLTANTNDHFTPALGVLTFGTANDVVNFDGMVVAELTSAEFSYAHTQAEIEAKYGYINSAQHIQNPYFVAYGKNPIPPFTEWTLHANAEVVSPYELKLVATATNQNSQSPKMGVVGGQTYTLSGTLPTNTRLRLYTYKGDGSLIAEISSAISLPYSFTLNADVELLLVEWSPSATGTFTFTNPMLNLGSTALLFEPANNDYGYIEGKFGSNLDGTVYDTLYQSGTELRKVKRFELDKVLDGTLAWVYVADFAGYKRADVLLPSKPQAQDKFNLVKFDGKIVPFGGGGKADEAQFHGNLGGTFIIWLADTDTGWGDAYTAVTADEIKAYFNGWKADAVDAGGKPTSWVSVVDSTQPSTDSLAYVSANKAPNYTPYSLSYQLANEVDEPVSGEFAINFHDGDNAVEFGEGAVLKEPANPSLYSGVYYINIKGNASIPDSPLKNRTSNILTIYKSGQPDKKWTLNIPSSTAYGTVYAKIPEADFDKTKPYYITYLLLDKHEHTVNVVESELSYNTNLKTVVDQLVTDQTDTQAEVDAIQKEIKPESLLAKLLTVDGTGSKLDADTVDGLHASSFSKIASGSYTGDGTTNRAINVGFAPKYVLIQSGSVGTLYHDVRGTFTSNVTLERYRQQSDGQTYTGKGGGNLTTTGFTIPNLDGNNGMNGSATYNYIAWG
jgi:hypothetical protein